MIDFFHPDVELYSCPELHKKLNTMFSSKDFAHEFEKMLSLGEGLSGFFFNHLFKDEKVMFHAFDCMIKFKLFGETPSMKQYFMYAKRAWNKYFQISDTLFCYALLNYKLNSDKIINFLSPLQVDLGYFFRWFFCDLTLKKNYMKSKRIEDYLQACNEYIFYIESMFNNPDQNVVAENLIRHLRRVKHYYLYLHDIIIEEKKLNPMNILKKLYGFMALI